MNTPLVFTCVFFFHGYFDREGLRFMWTPLLAHSPTTAQNIKGLVRSELERHDETHGSDGPHGSMPVGSGKGLSIATTENTKALSSAQIERHDENNSSDGPRKSVPWWWEKAPTLGPTALGMEVGAHCTGGGVM